ncbi:MAG: Cna B-type domain-containing protein [Clostridia bacterium]|nr:Cna B-type domain-containing protein [Clostridia bacterium]
MRAWTRKTHRRNHICRLAAALICLLLALPCAALASAAGSIEIHYSSEGGAIVGASFSLYRVAEIDAQGTFVPVGAFADCPVELKAGTAEEWRALAETLSGYALNAVADAKGITDGQGVLRFDNLSRGLYLLVGAELNDGTHRYLAEPALVIVEDAPLTLEPKSEVVEDEKISLRVIKVWKDKGYESKRPQEITVELYLGDQLVDTVQLNADNNWRYEWTNLPAGDWRVVERTKAEGYTVVISHEGNEYVITNSYTAPDSPKDDTPDGKLPQTGMLWWPVPLLSIAGVALFLAGWIRHRRGEN